LNKKGYEMSEKQIVVSEKAPKALGPYCVANRFGDLVFTAGQLGLDPATNELAPGGIEAETRQALTNVKHVLEAAGSSLACVLKTTVFLRDMADFARMNAVYAEFFTENFPARSTVQVAALPKNGAVEIETIACLVK
jgi:2-iminobutanoate/2-iminopropanoate deaminase